MGSELSQLRCRRSRPPRDSESIPSTRCHRPPMRIQSQDNLFRHSQPSPVCSTQPSAGSDDAAPIRPDTYHRRKRAQANPFSYRPVWNDREDTSGEGTNPKSAPQCLPLLAPCCLRPPVLMADRPPLPHPVPTRHPSSVPLPAAAVQVPAKLKSPERRKTCGIMACPVFCRQIVMATTRVESKSDGGSCRATPNATPISSGDLTYYRGLATCMMAASACRTSQNRRAESRPEFSFKLFATQTQVPEASIIHPPHASATPTDTPKDRKTPRSANHLKVNSVAANSPRFATISTYLPPQESRMRKHSTTSLFRQSTPVARTPPAGTQQTNTPANSTARTATGTTPKEGIAAGIARKDSSSRSPKDSVGATRRHSDIRECAKRGSTESIEGALCEKRKRERLMKKGMKQGEDPNVKSLAEKKRVWKGEKGVFDQALLQSWYRHMTEGK